MKKMLVVIIVIIIVAWAFGAYGDEKKPSTATLAGTAIGIAVGSLVQGPYHTAAMVIGGALGFLIGQKVDNARASEDAQKPIKTISWYRDSTGRQEWVERGQKTTIGEPIPEWVGK